MKKDEWGERINEEKDWWIKRRSTLSEENKERREAKEWVRVFMERWISLLFYCYDCYCYWLADIIGLIREWGWERRDMSGVMNAVWEWSVHWLVGGWVGRSFDMQIIDRIGMNRVDRRISPPPGTVVCVMRELWLFRSFTFIQFFALLSSHSILSLLTRIVCLRV